MMWVEGASCDVGGGTSCDVGGGNIMSYGWREHHVMWVEGASCDAVYTFTHDLDGFFLCIMSQSHPLLLLLLPHHQ